MNRPQAGIARTSIVLILGLCIVPVYASAGPQEVEELIQKLRSDKAEERDLATRKLREFGKAVIPALEKVARDPDVEVASRVRYLIEYAQLNATLPENLRREFPEILDRLCRNGDTAWRETFLEAVSEADGKRKHLKLTSEDLNYLAARAVRGALNREEKLTICDRVGRELLESAGAELSRLLTDTNPEVRHKAAFTIGQVGAITQAAPIVGLFTDPDTAVRKAAVDTLVRLSTLGEQSSAAELQKLLENGNPELRALGCEALGRMGVASSIPRLLKLLSDPDGRVRLSASIGLCHLGEKDGVPIALEEAEKVNVPSLSFLNAVREPAGWRKLIEKKMPGGRLIEQRPIPDILTEFTTLKIEASAKAQSILEQSPGSDIGMRFFPHKARTSLDLIQSTIDAKPQGIAFDFVLDTDRIRILRDFEARSYWKDWWSKQVGK